MISEPGRNDPCPCGSGKKYKKCCMEKGGAEIIPFPGTSFPAHPSVDLPFRQQDLDRYAEFAQSWDYDQGPVPTFMQFMGAANPSTDIVNDISAAARQHTFSSKAELEAFMRSQMDVQNNRGLDEFLGLSPSQMRVVIHENFTANSALVEFAPHVDDALIKEVTQIRWALWLLQRILSEEKGWKATQKGNLPRALVQEFYHEFHSGDPLYPRLLPSGEEDLSSIAVTKYLLKDLGLIKIRNGRYSATQKAEKVLGLCDWYSFYKDVFLRRAEKVSWLFHTRLRDEDEFVQRTLVFNLYLIAKLAADFTDDNILSDVYLKAFPHVLPEGMHGFYGFKVAFIHRFCMETGLLEEKDPGRDRFASGNVNSYKTTELFKQLFVWHV